MMYLATMMALMTGLMKAPEKALQMALSTVIQLEETKASMTDGLMEMMNVPSMAETMALQ